VDSSQSVFTILSFVGGGIRGLLSATILQRLAVDLAFSELGDPTRDPAFAVLMAMSGYIANAVDGAKRPNSLVGPMGVEFIPKLVNGPVNTFVAHPLTEALSSVTFEGGHPVKETSGTNTFVASIGADPVAVAAERVDGRIYLWGDEWVQYDMVWDGNPMIEKFWSNAIAWVGPKSFCVLPQ